METIQLIQKSLNMPEKLVMSDPLSNGRYDMRKAIAEEIVGHPVEMSDGRMPFFKEAYAKVMLSSVILPNDNTLPFLKTSSSLLLLK